MQIPNMAYQLFFFAALMVAVISVFALMSWLYYDYVSYAESDTQSLAEDDSASAVVRDDWAVDAPKDALSKRYPESGGSSSSTALVDVNGHDNAGYSKDTGEWEQHF